MTTLLRIDSSLRTDGSVSRALTGAFADAWTAAGGDVVSRDLQAARLPHLPYFGLHFPATPEDPAQWDVARALQNDVIGQVLAADALVIAAPLTNFSIPSTLKAWMDYLHVPGVSAADVPEEGPLAGKPVVIVSPRGAAYDEPGAEVLLDHAVPALEALLGSALGMAVEAITVDRTLANLLPELDEAKADALLSAATQKASERSAELFAQVQGL
ncbi:MAG: FMN-dependent NADH-azoreductase [Galactobacter sp.]